MSKFIDISEMQGNPTDWAVVKSQVDGVILRCGYRGYGESGTLVTDNTFEKKLSGCKSVGIPVGCYFFSQAKNAAEGKEEAQYACALYEKTNMELPLFIDSEWSTHRDKNKKIDHKGRADCISRSDRTNALAAFCKEVERQGHTPGVYASASWVNDKLKYSKIKKWALWVAYYTTTRTPVDYGIKSWYMWQYTSTGHIGAYNETNLDISRNGKNFEWLGDRISSAKTTEKTDSMLPSRGYWKRGDKDKRIAWIADFLYKNYPAYTSAKAKGKYFGPYLAASVGEFQIRTGLVPDKCVGPLTLAEMRKRGLKY